MQYNREEKQLAINFNLERADTTWEEANSLSQNDKFWHGCANRLYYAAFYAVIALLIKNDHYSKTHAGVRNLFNQHFVQIDIVQRETGRFYTKLFDKLQEGDYGTSTDLIREDIFPMIQTTKEFIETLKNLIEEN